MLPVRYHQLCSFGCHKFTSGGVAFLFTVLELAEGQDLLASLSQGQPVAMLSSCFVHVHTQTHTVHVSMSSIRQYSSATVN